MAELPALSDLSFHEGDNMGGVQAFRLAPSRYFSLLPFPIQGVIMDEPTFTGAFDWLQGYATVDSAEFRESCDWSESGPRWRSTFSCFVPGDSIAQRQNIEALARELLVLDCQDSNGLWRRMGDMHNRCRMEHRYTTGRGAANLNGYELTFTLQGPDPCPVLDADYVPSDPEDSSS